MIRDATNPENKPAQGFAKLSPHYKITTLTSISFVSQIAQNN